MGRKHRILHLIDSGGLYGAETVILNLSAAMKESNFIPVVGMLTTKEGSLQEVGIVAKNMGIEVMPIPLQSKFSLSSFFIIKKTLKMGKIDLIHSHGYKATILSFFPALLLHIPLVVTCHLWAAKGDWKLGLYHKIEAFFLRFVPVVIGVSEEICREIVLKGINKKKVRVIDNGIDLNNYQRFSSTNSAAIKKELNISSNDFVIGTIGRLTPQKAHHYLLEAVKILKNRNINIKCIILGEGGLRKPLEELCRKLGLEDMVFLPGYKDDIITALNLMDIFVLTSIDEGLPMVLLEAMATNKAIVTTPVGAIHKLIKHGVNGFLYPVGDTSKLADYLLMLLNDKEKKKTFGQKAYETFQNRYTSKIMAEKYMGIYKTFFVCQ